jgi:hypothetical protein
MLHFDQNRQLQWQGESDEHYVPLHPTDLVEFLCQHPALSKENADLFRQFCTLILAIEHHLYRQRHEQLMYVYSVLDPDVDHMLTCIPTDHQRDRLVDEMLERTNDVLQRANFRCLSEQEISQAMQVASLWGVRMRVKLDLQQWIRIYVRGDAIGTQQRRVWRNYYRKTTFQVPLYQRLVVLFRPQKDHPEKWDFRYVYLRMFKNIPKQDIDMMLPGSGIQMNWLDHSKILLPSLFTAGMTLWRILKNVFLIALFGVFKTAGIAVLVLIALGYGVKNLFTFRSNLVRRYKLNMTQSLYYQSLDNNAGVLLRILAEGERQESCEAIMVYFACILSEYERLSMESINALCSSLLREATGIRLNFDSQTALEGMVRLGIIHFESDGWRALPLRESIAQLDNTWDDWFNGSVVTVPQ